MAIPKHNECFKPFLEVIKDGSIYTLKEINTAIANIFNLTQSEKSELLKSGQFIFANRVGWARTYLKKAGLIESTSRGLFRITAEGKKVILENPTVIDNNYLMRYENFREFINSNKSNCDDNEPNKDIYKNEYDDTPDDIFIQALEKINNELKDELLTAVMDMSPASFERMSLNLLLKMGYGNFKDSGKTTGNGADSGIDGIIMEDKLGFSLIYIQAKRWDLKNPVGRPEIQKFVGAISRKGSKGLFITTTKFTKEAIEYANQQHIILIDGQKLTSLMIEYNFGVSIKQSFDIKALDSDLFDDYM